MKKIALTQGFVAMVDDDDYDYLAGKKWHVTSNKYCRVRYAKRWERIDGKNVLVAMHRVILGLSGSRPIVDHIDGNGLNNTRSNLRLSNHSQNLANSKKRRGGSSRFKGVAWHKHTKLWRSYIQKGKDKKYLGYFKSEIEAALAYNKEAVVIHGEFAKLNAV